MWLSSILKLCCAILNINILVCCISFSFAIIIGIEQQQVRRNGRIFESEFQAQVPGREQTDGPDDPLNIGAVHFKIQSFIILFIWFAVNTSTLSLINALLFV